MEILTDMSCMHTVSLKTALSICFRTVDSDFWSKLFGRILNADGKSTVPLLRELREEISGMFDSCFQERLCESLAALGETFLLENFL